MSQERRNSIHLVNRFPTTEMTLARREGCYLYDDDGREYLDLFSGLWCCALGHSHPRFVADPQVGPAPPRPAY